MSRAVALVVACSVVSVSLPRAAHAEEEPAGIVTLPPITAPVATPPRIFLNSSELMGRPDMPLRLGLSSPPALREIKLSEGAKTAIIIGAIIVGVLIIVGVAVVAAPGKKPPKP